MTATSATIDSTLGAALRRVKSEYLEWLVHWSRGTPELAASIGVSIAFTTFSTAFNLFAMRRGVLVVGAGSQSLLDDLRRMPRLMFSFIVAAR
jgi:hypothetical protein